MKVRAFEDPNGELLADPSLELVVSALENLDLAWESGAASIGWVELLDPGYRNLYEFPSLCLLQSAGVGVQLSYRIGNASLFPGTWLLAVAEDSQADTWVEHSLGGESVYFPRSSFLSVALAVQVIGDYLATEEPSPQVIWRQQRQIDEKRVGYFV